MRIFMNGPYGESHKLCRNLLDFWQMYSSLTEQWKIVFIYLKISTEAVLLSQTSVTSFWEQKECSWPIICFIHGSHSLFKGYTWVFPWWYSYLPFFAKSVRNIKANAAVLTVTSVSDKILLGPLRQWWWDVTVGPKNCK